MSYFLLFLSSLSFGTPTLEVILENGTIIPATSIEYVLDTHQVFIINDSLYYDGEILLPLCNRLEVITQNNEQIFPDYVEYDLDTKKIYLRGSAIFCDGFEISA